jgi:hypothetical protein
LIFCLLLLRAIVRQSNVFNIKTPTMNKLIPAFCISLFSFGTSIAQTDLAENYRLYPGDSLKGFDLNSCYQEMNRYDVRVHLNAAEKKNFMQIREHAFIQKKYLLGGPVFDEAAWRIADLAEQKAGPHRGPKKLILRSENKQSMSSPASQGMAGCDNLDWEDNNVSNWSGTMGYATTTTLVYYGVAPLNGAPGAGQTKFVSAGAGGTIYFGPSDSPESGCSGVTLVSTGTDPYGNFPMVGAGSFSVRMGGENVNLGMNFGPPKCNRGDAVSPFESAGELVQQTIALTSSNCMITYSYDVVLADGGHAAGSQPFFQAGVIDQTGSEIQSALYYQECTAGVPPPGYGTSAKKDPIDATASVYYSNWQSNTVDLSPYIGTTVTMYFFSAGCIPGGHFGYAYIDGHCGPKIFATVGPEVCVGQTTTVDAPAFPVGTTYTWSGPGIVGSTTGSSILVNTVGNYTVTGTLPAPNSGSTTSVIASVPFYAASAITPSSTNPLCSNGTNGTATATLSGGNTPYTYNWTGAGYGGGGQGTNTATSLTCGTYTLDVTTSNGCHTAKTFPITCPTPLVLGTTLTNPSCGACSDGSITALASGGTPAYTYSWSPAPSAGQGTSVASGLAAGQYTATITDTNNCTTTSTVLLSFVTGLTNSSLSDVFDVYPNPASDHIAIGVGTTHNPSGLFTICNMLGQQMMVVKQEPGKGFKQNLDVSSLSEGIYFICMETNTGKLIRKFTIKR